MRVIAKTKDYYDSLMETSNEASIVYFRFQSELLINVDDYFQKKSTLDFRNWKIQDFIDNTLSVCIDEAVGIYCSLSVVGFCGSFYPCITVRLHQPETPLRPSTKSFYTDNDALSHVNKVLLERKKRALEKFSDNRSIRGHVIEEFFKFDFSKFSGLFTKLKVPVFILNFNDEQNITWSYSSNVCKIKCVLNPTLKDYDFFRKFDVNQTFQEISMYIGGVLGGSSPPMAEIEDKYRIEAHGFDKWSFRRMPEEKK